MSQLLQKRASVAKRENNIISIFSMKICLIEVFQTISGMACEFHSVKKKKQLVLGRKNVSWSWKTMLSFKHDDC